MLIVSHSRIWDTSTGQCLRTLVYEENPAAASVCFSPNGRFVLASYTDSCVRLWDFINMPCTVKKTYQGHVNKNYSIGGCFGLLRSMRRVVTTGAITGGEDENNDSNNNNNNDSPEGDFREEQWVESDSVAFVASASEDGAIVLWDVKTKEVLQRVEAAHTGVCFWVDVHGDTGTMVSCGQDGRIVVFRHQYADATPIEEDSNGRPSDGHAEGLGGGDDDLNSKYPQDPEEDMVMRDDAADETTGKDGYEKDAAASSAEYLHTNGHQEYSLGGEDHGEAPPPLAEAVDAAIGA